jgi:activator-of-BECN1-regulated-autophagy protein 1
VKEGAKDPESKEKITMYFHDYHVTDDDDMSLDWMPRRRKEQEEPPVILPPPSPQTIEQRQAFRKTILEQTLQHRRIELHGGMGDTGRNIASVLRDREQYGAQHCVMKPRTKESRSMTYPMQVFREVQIFAEYSSVTRYHSSYLHHLGGQAEQDDAEEQDRTSSNSAVSTISISFSPDSQTMASTHGDHTVKITCCSTGQLLQTLEGHPRTPWTVKYHPTNNDVVASGCLGCQVRVWGWKEGNCLRMIRLDHAIISLSFHPSGHILAIASGSRLHFWDYNNFEGRQDENGNTNNNTRGALTEVEQRHMLRCVHFPPNGTTLIVGGTNPPSDEQRRRGRGGMSGGGMSFYLRLWEFDLHAALHPEERDARDVRTLSRTVRLHRKALSNVS